MICSGCRGWLGLSGMHSTWVFYSWSSCRSQHSGVPKEQSFSRTFGFELSPEDPLRSPSSRLLSWRQLSATNAEPLRGASRPILGLSTFWFGALSGTDGYAHSVGHPRNTFGDFLVVQHFCDHSTAPLSPETHVGICFYERELTLPEHVCSIDSKSVSTEIRDELLDWRKI